MPHAAVLAAFITVVPHVNRFDVLELNHVHDEHGRQTLVQWIAWDFDHAAGAHRCQWWTRHGGEISSRTADGWRLVVGGKRIESRSYRETWSVGDPEVADRAVFETTKRRGVR